MQSYPALDQLMGAYFHQDWPEEASDSDGVIDLFIANEPESARRLPAEIEAVLSEFPDELNLRAFILEDLGACYLADVDGGTYRQWLTQIADRVRAATT